MNNQNIVNHPKLKDYNETIQKLLDGEMYQQAATTCRLALEYMVSQFVIEFSQSLNLCDTLFEKINGLKTNGVIDNDWVINSDYIRKIVNDGGAHDNTTSTGHVISSDEAREVFNKLDVLESYFLNKIPFVSTKEIKEEFKNKRFEEDIVLKRLKANPYIFNISRPHESRGETWYTFYFKIKTSSLNEQYITPEYQEFCGKDGEFNIYRINERRKYVNAWIEEYLDIIEENNITDTAELDLLCKQEKTKRELKRKKVQREYENSKKRNSANIHTFNEKIVLEYEKKNSSISLLLFLGVFIEIGLALYVVICVLEAYDVINLGIPVGTGFIAFIIGVILVFRIYNRRIEYQRNQDQINAYRNKPKQ